MQPTQEQVFANQDALQNIMLHKKAKLDSMWMCNGWRTVKQVSRSNLNFANENRSRLGCHSCYFCVPGRQEISGLSNNHHCFHIIFITALQVEL